jgi:hypothetical protein
VGPGEVTDQHHGSGDGDGETGAEERVEPLPLQIGKPQALIGHAALLEEQLPGGDGRSDDRNDEEDVARAHPLGWIDRHERVVEELAPRDSQVPAHHQPYRIEQTHEHHHPLPAPIARGEDDPD